MDGRRDHAVAVGTNERQIFDLRLRSRLESVDGLRMVNFDEPTPPFAILPLEIEPAAFTGEGPWSSQAP